MKSSIGSTRGSPGWPTRRPTLGIGLTLEQQNRSDNDRERFINFMRKFYYYYNHSCVRYSKIYIHTYIHTPVRPSHLLTLITHLLTLLLLFNPNLHLLTHLLNLLTLLTYSLILLTLLTSFTHLLTN